MYEYGGGLCMSVDGVQCMSMKGASVWLWTGPVYECRGGQCISMEGASV